MSKLSFIDIIKISTTPDFKEFFDPATLEQIKIMATNVNYNEIAKATWEQLKKETKEVIDKADGKLKKEYIEYWKKIFEKK